MLDFLLNRHPLRTRRSLGDALSGPYRTLYNETRFLGRGLANCIGIYPRNQYKCSSCPSSITQSEVGYATQVRTNPASTCSSSKKD